MPLDDFTNEIVQRLNLLGRVTARSMFGGAGLYCDGIFFGLTANEQLFLRVDDQSRPLYEQHGMSFFQPWPDKPQHGLRNYYEVPVSIQRRREELCSWAATALEVARLVKKKSRPKTKRAVKKRSTSKPIKVAKRSKKN